MTTFNELGTAFADLADRVKKEALLTDSARDAINSAFNTMAERNNAFFDALESVIAEHRRQTKEQHSTMREAILDELAARSSGLMDTLGPDASAPDKPESA